MNINFIALYCRPLYYLKCAILLKYIRVFIVATQSRKTSRAVIPQDVDRIDVYVTNDVLPADSLTKSTRCGSSFSDVTKNEREQSATSPIQSSVNIKCSGQDGDRPEGRHLYIQAIGPTRRTRDALAPASRLGKRPQFEVVICDVKVYWITDEYVLTLSTHLMCLITYLGLLQRLNCSTTPYSTALSLPIQHTDMLAYVNNNGWNVSWISIYHYEIAESQRPLVRLTAWRRHRAKMMLTHLVALHNLSNLVHWCTHCGW